MKKVLFTAHVDSHILNFHLPYLKYFKDNGFEVHVASKGDSRVPHADVKYNIPFHRLPFKFQNLTAYGKLKAIINENHYTLIHCNTPIGGVLTRLAAFSARNKGTKVVYTAHGFHFYTGAPLNHWAIYFPVEKWLSRYTDCLITINDEDYQNTIKHRFSPANSRLVHGVGIDLNRFSPEAFGERSQLRKKYGYQPDDFILIFAAELNFNKHQDLLIQTVGRMKEQIPQIRLLLVGDGPLSAQYEDQVSRLDLKDHVHFLEYRKDIPELLKLSDVAVSSSRREGLPLNVLEAMAMELPLVVTNSRGNRDLVWNAKNGFVVHDDVGEFTDAILKLYQSREMREKFGLANRLRMEKYSLDTIMAAMKEIYEGLLENSDLTGSELDNG